MTCECKACGHTFKLAKAESFAGVPNDWAYELPSECPNCKAKFDLVSLVASVGISA